MQAYVTSIPAETMRGLRVATFDTRFSSRLVRIFGYAADRLARDIESKGGTVAASPEGFIVRSKEGPLKEGEIERASQWGRTLTK